MSNPTLQEIEPRIAPCLERVHPQSVAGELISEMYEALKASEESNAKLREALESILFSMKPDTDAHRLAVKALKKGE